MQRQYIYLFLVGDKTVNFVVLALLRREMQMLIQHIRRIRSGIRIIIPIGMLLLAGAANSQTDTLTIPEIRTLKNAVTVLQYQPQIDLLIRNCPADMLQYLPSVITEADTSRVQALFQQKLQITTMQLAKLLKENEKFSSLTRPAVFDTPDCSDREAIVDFAEQFSNNYTALELSDALGSWKQHFLMPTDTAAVETGHLSDLINSSHSIVLVKIQPKSILTPLQQANFLHIDDKSSYVFEVQQGWKAIGPRYLGLHIHIRPENYAQQPKLWLLLLDSRFHPKTALHGTELQQGLKQLATADWTFNRQGDLVRAGN